MAQTYVDLTIHINEEDWLDTYRGQVKSVFAYTDDGRSVRFPTQLLTKFVTRQGIHGRFRIFFDHRGKFTDIDRLG